MRLLACASHLRALTSAPASTQRTECRGDVGLPTRAASGPPSVGRAIPEVLAFGFVFLRCFIAVQGIDGKKVGSRDPSPNRRRNHRNGWRGTDEKGQTLSQHKFVRGRLRTTQSPGNLSRSTCRLELCECCPQVFHNLLNQNLGFRKIIQIRHSSVLQPEQVEACLVTRKQFVSLIRPPTSVR